MTNDRVLVWAIAELSASAGVAAALGSPALVGNQDRDTGSEPGVFLWVPQQTDRERFADDCPLRVRGYARPTRAAAVALADAVRDTLLKHPGSPKAWGVAPASRGLRLKAIRLELATLPEREGTLSDGYAFNMVYAVSGKDTAEGV